MVGGLAAELAAAAAIFVGTTADNAEVTTAMVVAAPPEKERRIVVGQVLGFGVLVGVSAVTAAVLFEIPVRIVGLLGVVLVALGVRDLVLLIRRAHRDPSRRAVGRGSVSSAFVTIVAGGDNLAAYIPLFRSGGVTRIALVVATFCAGETLFSLFVLWATHHERVRALYARLRAAAGPILACATGVLVLWWAGTI